MGRLPLSAFHDRPLKKVEIASLTNGDVVTVADTTFRIEITQPSHQEFPATVTMPPVLAHEALNGEWRNNTIPEIPGFAVDRMLGQGAMGAVFLGYRLSTGEKVAIKVVRPLIEASHRATERFQREASIVLRLQHKRIVRCMDFSLTKDNLPYLVMEFVEEIKIRDFLGTLEPSDRIRVSVGLIVRLLEGLQYAHSREIVHRDVKPTNILVFRSGPKLQLKLADFGLAKNYIDAGFSDCSVSNDMCGTLAYMPPEQIMNCRFAKPACDIYAAGVCLYHFISGRLPHEAAQATKQIALILNQPPTPITAHAAMVPAGLLRIISKSLSREPSDRFVSAEAMRQELLPYSKRR